MRVDNIYKLDMTGASDNAAELAHLASDMAALSAAKKPLPSLVFPDGILSFSKWPNLALPNIQIRADGECHLQHTGSGDAVTFTMGDLTNPKEQGDNNVTFTGFIIDSSGSGNALVINGCHRSRFDVWVEGRGTTNYAGHAGVVVNFCVVTEIRPRVRGMDLGVVFDNWPNNPNLPPTICTVTQPIIEGCRYGMYLRNAAQTRVYGGTIESCTVGVRIDNGGNNHFYSIDMEGNSSYDAMTANEAHDNKFFYCGEGHPSKFKSQFLGWNNRLIHDLQDGLFGL